MQIDLIHQTVIRWNDPDPKYIPLLADGGVTAVIGRLDPGFSKACADAAIVAAAENEVQFLSLEDAAKAKPGAPVVIKSGLWPGVQRPDPQVASATRSLWMDQNCGLVNAVRALHPQLPPVLGYLPDQDAGVSKDRLLPYDSLELALVEAWVSGGNYVLALHPRFREGLLNGASDALAAWKKIGRTARWLRANEPLFRQPPLPIVTILVDGGEIAQEIANLSFRQSVSPALARAANPPAPDPSRRLVLVAAGIDTPTANAKARILAHPQAGTVLMVEGRPEKAWWNVPGVTLVKSDPDHDFYRFGKGQIVSYKEGVGDPGMLALDVIDVVTQKRRPTRIWNCNAGLAIAASAPRTGPVTGAATLSVINYGRMVDSPVLARIQGTFQRAELLRPEAAPLELKVAPRGTASEVTIPGVDRVSTVVFK